MRRINKLRLGLILVPVLIAVSHQARSDEPLLPDERLGLPTAPLLLLSRADVRADVGLTPEQASAAAREGAALHVRAAGLKGKKSAEIVQERRAIDDAQQRWLSDNLSADQRDRLAQIELQWEGPAALLHRKALADELALNADQRKVLAEAVAQREAQRARGKATPADEMPLAERTLSILTAEQRSRWHTLLGRPCTFQLHANRISRESRDVTKAR